MSMRRLFPAAILATCAACNGSSGAGTGSSASAAAPAPSARPRASASSTAAPAPPRPRPSAAPKPPPPPPFNGKANQISLLPGTVGLQVQPPFAYRLESFDVFWKVYNAADDGKSIYLMRKAFPADKPVGDVVPCANKSDYQAKAEPDGSFTYKCLGSASGDGTWFARIVPNKEGFIESLLCSGSSKDPKWLRDIEAVCRSIKPKK
jgi:hypothetical protein